MIRIVEFGVDTSHLLNLRSINWFGMAYFTVGMGAAIRVEEFCRLTVFPQEELYLRLCLPALP